MAPVAVVVVDMSTEELDGIIRLLSEAAEEEPRLQGAAELDSAIMNLRHYRVMITHGGQSQTAS